MHKKIYRVIGLMSGTSLDGVDVALIETDGMGYVAPKGFYYLAYNDELRARIRACFGTRIMNNEIYEIEHDLTMAHVDAINKFLYKNNIKNNEIDLIGFHGQTITHDPAHGFTWQLGDGDLLAKKTGINVVYDFRTNDVNMGGQGAPLIPIYHSALVNSANLEMPIAILNIGGISNVTLIDNNINNLLAFDCGMGNALIDDIVLKTTGEKCDWDGKIAATGQINQEILSKLLSHEYFNITPPKSLDRGAWNIDVVSGLKFEDAVATLTAFTVAAIINAAKHFPVKPKSWYVAGGGRLNKTIMNDLSVAFCVPVEPVDKLGWNGDAVEAEGFAYMAVRSILGLPLSFPRTTGVATPTTGGILCHSNL